MAVLASGTGPLGVGRLGCKAHGRPNRGELDMDDKSRADSVIKARAAYAARREVFCRAASPGRDTSPRAVEATLASISEEVTADAIERRRNKDKPR